MFYSRSKSSLMARADIFARCWVSALRIWVRFCSCCCCGGWGMNYSKLLMLSCSTSLIFSYSAMGSTASYSSFVPKIFLTTGWQTFLVDLRGCLRILLIVYKEKEIITESKANGLILILFNIHVNTFRALFIVLKKFYMQFCCQFK